MKCLNCGHPLNEGDLFCGECGTKVERVEKVVSEPVKQTVTPKVKPEPKPEVTQESVSHNSHQQTAATNPTPPASPKMNVQSNQLVNEAKDFFTKAFKNHDQAISDGRIFSPVLSGILFGAGLLLSLLILYLKVPEEIISFGVSKGDIAFKLFLFILVYSAVSMLAAFGLTKAMISSKVSFTKVFSDYVLVNTYSAIVGIVGLLFFSFKSFSFGNVVALLGLLMLGYSGVYLIAKYSVLFGSKLPSFLAVVVYTIIMAVVFLLFKDTFTDLILTIIKGAFQNAVSDTVNSLTNGLFGR